MNHTNEELEEEGGDDAEFLSMGEAIRAAKAKKPKRPRRTPEEEALDPVGIAFYGAENFKRWNKVGEIVGLLPLWKEFYYERRVKEENISITALLKEFNQKHAYPESLTFHPYPTQVKIWRTKWDRDILEKKMEMKVALVPSTQKEIRQIIKTKEGDNFVAPDDVSLEQGVRTLGGELINDALQMLRDDQNLGELYSDEVLLKRRNFIVNVFAHTTRLVHGKATLMLKASAEKREGAGFMMGLLAKAASGKMTDEEMNMLKSTYSKPVVTEIQNVQPVV